MVSSPTLLPLPQVRGYPLEEGGSIVEGEKVNDGRQNLEEVCSEFESLFIYNVLKQMRKTVPKSGLISGGKGEEIFTSFLDEELSKQMAVRQGMGLREALIEQLSGGRRAVPSQGMMLHGYMGKGNGFRSKPHFVFPVEGHLSSLYGWRKDPFTGERDFHHGVDLASPLGSRVYAAGGGRVAFSGWKKGYGNVIEIEHPDGMCTVYAHTFRNLVKEGEMVSPSQVIALVGNSGRSTGPHLHFEIRKDGESVDPLEILFTEKRGRLYAKEF